MPTASSWCSVGFFLVRAPPDGQCWDIGMDAINQALDDLVSSGAHTELTNGGPKGKCAMCGAKAPAGQSLLGCAGCKIAWYCGRECQVRAVGRPARVLHVGRDTPRMHTGTSACIVCWWFPSLSRLCLLQITVECPTPRPGCGLEARPQRCLQAAGKRGPGIAVHGRGRAAEFAAVAPGIRRC